MTRIPFLLVEDEPSARNRFEILLERTATALTRKSKTAVELPLTVAEDYREGLKQVSLGTFPVVVLDLKLPDPLAGADQGIPRFPGLELVIAARGHNKDVLAAVYTAHCKDAFRGLLDRHIDELLDKTADDADLVTSLLGVAELAMARFNCTIEDVGVAEALRWAFGTAPPQGSTTQWEMCLRRLFCHGEKEIAYNFAGRGRSGAGIVVAQADNFLPVIVKCDEYAALKAEADRYDRFVKCYIPMRAITSRDDLAQSADIGMLAYSFVGKVHKPTTLAKAMNEADLVELTDAIASHFDENCLQWFAHDRGSKPYELAAKLRGHLAHQPEVFRKGYSQEKARPAFEKAADYLGINTQQLVGAIENAIVAPRRNTYCRPETIVHGDLNVNNLIWDAGYLWMIDFAKTGPGPRILDFAKLEASVKKDVELRFGLATMSDEDRLAAVLAVEEKLLGRLAVDVKGMCKGVDESLARRIAVIAAVRQCAVKQAGSEPEKEYWLALFMVAAKHVEYLVKDIRDGRDVYVPLVNALVSAFQLAGMVEDTVVR